jgi:hypothetical protein
VLQSVSTGATWVANESGEEAGWASAGGKLGCWEDGIGLAVGHGKERAGRPDEKIGPNIKMRGVKALGILNPIDFQIQTKI